MSNFQTIFIAIFLAFFVFGVAIFSGIVNIGNSNNSTGLQGKVVIWGTFPSASLKDVIKNIKTNNRDLNLSYVNKNSATYQQELIKSFANGNGPDLFIISPDMIVENKNFIYEIPYASYPEKNFRDSYIDGADVYLDSEGIFGYPMVVDPMVLYYNKDILSNTGIVNPPKNWDELFTLNPMLTKRDNAGMVFQSMIALGQYNNINNVKDILAALLIQNDNPIVKSGYNFAGNLSYIATLSLNTSNLSVSPAETVFKFFVEFSNPSNTAYSWNRSLPNSLDMFTAGKLAFYLGKASELFNIQDKNPNLSFDVTQIPQIKDSANKRTLGDIYAAVINKKTANLASTQAVAELLSDGTNAKNFSVAVSLPPASKTLLANKPTDPYLYLFFNSAIISKSWLDPNNAKSDLIFGELIDNILSNKLSVGEAIGKAQGQLDILTKQ